MLDEKISNTILEEMDPDPRDYDITRFVPGHDEIGDIEFMLDLPKMEIILDQIGSSCCGHAFAMAKSISEYQRTHKWIKYCPYWIYGTRFEGEYDGPGMYLRQGAKVLYKKGAVLSRDFGVIEEMPELARDVETFNLLNSNLVEKAKDSCIEGYAVLRATYHSAPIKTALKAGMPVVVSIDSWGGMGGVDGVVKKSHNPSGPSGRHAVVIVGWTTIRDSSYWIIINSWGTDTGYKGLLFFEIGRKLNDVISISDTITPIKKKCKKIEFVLGESTFMADDETKTFEAAPYVKHKRTYLPVRFVAENLGASVEWDAKSGVATIRSEEAIIEISNRSKIMTINGVEAHMDVVPEIVNGRMMAPIRFIAEALNCSVDWIENENKAIIEAL